MSTMSDAPTAKRLFDMEIDEISVVKRGANRHATISIAKSDSGEEDQMPDLFDVEGDLVDEGTLVDGDQVFDVEGNGYVFVDESEENEGAEPESELVDSEVGKFFSPKAVPAGVLGLGKDKAKRAGKHVKRNKKLYGAGAAGAGAGLLAGAAVTKSDEDGVDMANENTEPSLGDLLLEELSKSEDSGARDELLAAAVEEIEIVKAQAVEAQRAADHEHDIRVEEAFVSKAATYNLPVAPEVLGPILKAAATALSDEQLDVLDQLFDSVGDTLFDEIGAVGDTDNASVMNQVDAAALELVGKSDDVTGEVASAALFDANPELYDAYLAEGR